MGILHKLFGRKKENKRENNIVRFTLKKDSEDARDYTYKRTTLTSPLPAVVEVKNRPPIRDQGNIGYCFSFAGIRALETEYLNLKPNKFLELSEMYLGYNTRVLNGTIPNDQGATIRDMLKALSRWHAATEYACPYVPAKMNEKPCWAAYATSGLYKMKSYQRCNNIEDIKHALSQGHVVIVGMMVKKDLMSLRPGEIYYGKGQDVGGHAMVLTKTDDEKKLLSLDNSWGNWGTNGSFRMPYDVFFRDAWDYWVLKIQ